MTNFDRLIEVLHNGEQHSILEELTTNQLQEMLNMINRQRDSAYGLYAYRQGVILAKEWREEIIDRELFRKHMKQPKKILD